MSNTPPRPSKANVEASSSSSASPSAGVQNNETKSREISSEFKELLDKARSEDFSDLTRCGCVQIYPATRPGDCAVVVVLPKLALVHDSTDTAVARMMTLLLLLMNDIANGPYVLIYAQTPMSILSQQSVILKYYNMLPHTYKKNIKKLYILRPGFAVKVFFEFARVFLSEKFYKKLQQFSSLVELQAVISPSFLNFPLELHHIEDQLNGVSFAGPVASIADSFISELGTTCILHSCINYLKEQKALSSKGIFRISGDEMSLNVAKVRLQSKLCKACDVYLVLESLGTTPSSEITKKKGFKRFVIVCDTVKIGKPTLLPNQRYDLLIGEPGKETAAAGGTVETREISTVFVSEVNSIAQLIKFIFRDLDEPVITLDAYDKIEAIVNVSKAAKIEPSVWVKSVIEVLQEMPVSHFMTLDHLLRFLAEISSKSAENSMNSSNLAIVFGPGVMRRPLPRAKRGEMAQQEDMGAVMKAMGLGQAVITALIDEYMMSASTSATSTAANSSNNNNNNNNNDNDNNSNSNNDNSNHNDNSVASVDPSSIAIKMSDTMMKRTGTGLARRTTDPPVYKIEESLEDLNSIETNSHPGSESSREEIPSSDDRKTSGGESAFGSDVRNLNDDATAKFSNRMLQRGEMSRNRSNTAHRNDITYDALVDGPGSDIFPGECRKVLSESSDSNETAGGGGKTVQEKDSGHLTGSDRILDPEGHPAAIHVDGSGFAYAPNANLSAAMLKRMSGTSGGRRNASEDNSSDGDKLNPRSI